MDREAAVLAEVRERVAVSEVVAGDREVVLAAAGEQGPEEGREEEAVQVRAEAGAPALDLAGVAALAAEGRAEVVDRVAAPVTEELEVGLGEAQERALPENG